MASANDIRKQAEEKIRITQTLIDLQKQELASISNIFSIEANRQKVALDILGAEQRKNALFDEYQKNAATSHKNTIRAIEKELQNQQKTINQLKNKQKILTAISNINFSNITRLTDSTMGFFGGTFNDKPIRETVLNLGLGAEKAQMMRDAFYDALPGAVSLGASMAELRDIQIRYAEETGRATMLTGQQLQLITEIGKGTFMGVDGASRLVAQFEILGVSTQKSHEIIQGIVDSSERMGVNTTKVLRNINTNFKALNTFAFRSGIKGMAKMSQYAEKFKVDMHDALNSARVSRSLEGAIALSSELQVLGGEFAKADPFEMLFLSRNDPAEYTKKINEMTKGLANLTQTADGFQIKISPLDLDRLRFGAEALNIPFENLVQQAQRMGEIQAMNKQLMGTSFSKEDRQMIQSMAKLDNRTGLFTVLGKSISDLSAKEIKSLQVQQTTLKERAEAAQTFDEKWNNSIQAMKYTLIPILDGINYVFDTLQPIMRSITDTMKGMPDIVKKLLVGGGVFLGASLAISKTFSLIKSMPLVGGLLGKGKGAAPAAPGAGGAGGGMLANPAAAGTMKNIGIAAAGMGAGIGAAAAGIGYLAKNLKGLDAKQLSTLEKVSIGLGLSIPIFAVGLVFLGKAAEVSAVGIGILAASIFVIGAGVAIAGAGIGYMSEGMSKLVKATDGGKTLLNVAAGVTALAGGLTLMGNPLSFLGMTTFAGTMATIAMSSGKLEKVGDAFKNIAVVLSSSKDDFAKVEKSIKNIASAKAGDGNFFSEIKSLLTKPLKVEFANKDVALNVDVTLEMDSEKIARKLNLGRRVEILHTEYQQGKNAPRRS